MKTTQRANYETQLVRQVEEAEVRESLQARIIYEEGPFLMSDMENSIREWIFQEKYALLEHFIIAKVIVNK